MKNFKTCKRLLVWHNLKCSIQLALTLPMIEFSRFTQALASISGELNEFIRGRQLFWVFTSVEIKYCKFKFYRDDASSNIIQKIILISKEFTIKEAHGAWYNSEIREAKEVMRKAENRIISMAMTIIEPNFV